jgi:hypothetical protein
MENVRGIADAASDFQTLVGQVIEEISKQLAQRVRKSAA